MQVHALNTPSSEYWQRDITFKELSEVKSYAHAVQIEQ